MRHTPGTTEKVGRGCSLGRGNRAELVGINCCTFLKFDLCQRSWHSCCQSTIGFQISIRLREIGWAPDQQRPWCTQRCDEQITRGRRALCTLNRDLISTSGTESLCAALPTKNFKGKVSHWHCAMTTCLICSADRARYGQIGECR